MTYGREIIAAARRQWAEDAERAGHVNGDGARSIATSQVRRKQVRWLWPGRLPRGKLVVLDGDPDLGKSTLALDLAARLSVGATMPDGHRLDGPSTVILLSAEDGVADTICPRLAAAGADGDRVRVFVEVETYDEHGAVAGVRPPELPRDLERLEAMIERFGADLVIVDVLMAFLAGDVNAHHDQDVRRVLHALARIAERLDCTIIVIRHLNKSGGGKALYRGGGSIGIVGAARVGLIVAEDPDDASRRILAVAKCNLAGRASALAYVIEEHPIERCGHIRWLGTTRHSADQLVAPRVDDGADARPRALAAEFLTDLLAEGPMAVQDVKRAAQDAGLTWGTVRRAQEDLGITPTKVGRPGDREQWWQWAIPAPKMRTIPEDAQCRELSTFGQFAHLRGDEPTPSAVDDPPVTLPFAEPDQSEPGRPKTGASDDVPSTP